MFRLKVILSAALVTGASLSMIACSKDDKGQVKQTGAQQKTAEEQTDISQLITVTDKTAVHNPAECPKLDGADYCKTGTNADGKEETICVDYRIYTDEGGTLIAETKGAVPLKLDGTVENSNTEKDGPTSFVAYCSADTLYVDGMTEHASLSFNVTISKDGQTLTENGRGIGQEKPIDGTVVYKKVEQ